MAVLPYARTRINLIPKDSQEVSTSRSRLLGANTTRGCGVTEATFNDEMLEGIHALARLDLSLIHI
eukprot:3213576-Prorocentrum_lima.AAC.1